jgi:adenylate cyclase
MGRAGWRRRKTAMLIAVAVLAGGLGVAAYATHLLRRTELQTIDARFSIRGRHSAPADVLLVKIDNATLQKFAAHGERANFPFPRVDDARVIDHLRQAGARVIAIDLQFTQPTDAADDNALIEALQRAHGKTVLAATEVAADGSTPLLGGGGLPEKLGARPASSILTVDTDGVTRRFPYAYSHLRSFAVAAQEVATGHSVPASRFSGGSLPIDFAGPPGTVHAISYWDVLRGKFSAGAVRGKIVIVGASAPILADVHAAATTNGATMAGPEIWGNAVSTLTRGAPLTNAPGWLNLLLTVLMGILVPLGSLRLQPLRALLDGLAAAIMFTVFTQVAFDQGWILSFVYPLFALTVATLGTLAVVYLSETIERERVHDLFSRFVPADVVDQVVASAGDNLRLGAVERDCTVLFSDLRGFTSFSETLPATTVIEVVNCYLNEMTEAILGAGGTLIAYMGDGIMAVFGAPLEQDDHADRALAAAREMIGTRLQRFNAWLAEQGHDHAFAMGVGVNSGAVMAGNIGSERRVEYTALGDTTNTASRLEGMTKGSGHMLFVAETTRERMQRAPEGLVLVGELEIRGRVSKLAVWTVEADGADTPAAGGDPATAGRADGRVPDEVPLEGNAASGLLGGK